MKAWRMRSDVLAEGLERVDVAAGVTGHVQYCNKYMNGRNP
jgi:hypothetical protein